MKHDAPRPTVTRRCLSSHATEVFPNLAYLATVGSLTLSVFSPTSSHTDSGAPEPARGSARTGTGGYTARRSASRVCVPRA
eukprot:1631607-Prymnesium_polylepis.3